MGPVLLQPRYMHYARMRLVNNQTLALLCTSRPRWLLLHTGLRSVSNLAATWVACVQDADRRAAQQQQQQQQQQQPCSAHTQGTEGAPGAAGCLAHPVNAAQGEAGGMGHAQPTQGGVTSVSGAPAAATRMPAAGFRDTGCSSNLASDANVPAGPKLLADMLEAVLGAVLVDADAGGGEGLAAVWAVFCGIARAACMEHLAC